MANKSKKAKETKTKADPRIVKSSENFLIEKEKRYQRKIKGPQVEKQTLLKETKKKSLPKPSNKRK